jgi:hypothetical protein
MGFPPSFLPFSTHASSSYLSAIASLCLSIAASFPLLPFCHCHIQPYYQSVIHFIIVISIFLQLPSSPAAFIPMIPLIHLLSYHRHLSLLPSSLSAFLPLLLPFFLPQPLSSSFITFFSATAFLNLSVSPSSIFHCVSSLLQTTPKIRIQNKKKSEFTMREANSRNQMTTAKIF